ncbi:MAG: hypothetical protein GWN87_26840, partial [Desulfuromonadales bacterium]|nr:hypothetical protein [Desulfuromonadales bacterium]
MRTFPISVLALFFPVFVSAASLELVPSSIGTGEVALLEYRGAPPAMAVGQFQGDVFFMTPEDAGASALIG